MSHLNCSWRNDILNSCYNFFQGSHHRDKEMYLKTFINAAHSQHLYDISLGWILSLFIFITSHVLVMLQSKFLILSGILKVLITYWNWVPWDYKIVTPQRRRWDWKTCPSCFFFCGDIRLYTENYLNHSVCISISNSYFKYMFQRDILNIRSHEACNSKTIKYLCIIYEKIKG